MATQARSIASRRISFGLVAIPVKLYSATLAKQRNSREFGHGHRSDHLNKSIELKLWRRPARSPLRFA